MFKGFNRIFWENENFGNQNSLCKKESIKDWRNKILLNKFIQQLDSFYIQKKQRHWKQIKFHSILEILIFT